MKSIIEIRKNKIDLPIKDDLDKIHYLSTLSDKKFQNKLSHINDNLDKIIEKIKEFVELLSSESRKNDEYISEKIYESLQEIFKVAKNDTEIDFNKLKQKIINQLDKHLTISKNNKIKTKIEKYIEENISKEFSTPNNQSNQTTPNKKSSTTYTQKTINVKLPKKDTKQIYSNILTNSVFINKINKKIKDTCTTVLNDLKIKNVSKSNLKASKTNKLVLRTFLTNYNSKVEKTIVQTKKSIDKETTKTRTVNDVIRSKIKRVVQKVKRFTMKINPINWYKKARNKLRKLKKRFGSFWGTTFFIVGVPIFLFKMVGKITSFITSIAFKIANVVAKIAFKLLAIVAKLALKVITKVLKTALLILKGVFKIVTKTLGLVFSIIKKVFNIAKGITKFVVKTVSKFLKPLKYLKYLLLTPQGMYVVGLICGFLVKKITGYILFLGGNAKNGLSNLGIMIKKGINKTIEKIKEKINNIAIKIGKKLLKRHNELQDKDLTLSKDVFGIPKINDEDNYIKIKEKIELKILTWFENYIGIFSKENSVDEKMNELKQQFKNDYENSKIKKFIDKIKDYSKDDVVGNLQELDLNIQKLIKSDFVRLMTQFSLLTAIGIPQHKATQHGLGKLASTAIKGASVLSGAAIGALFGANGGPWGALAGAVIGGAIGGIIAAIVEDNIASKTLELTTKNFTIVNEIIRGRASTFQKKSESEKGEQNRMIKANADYRRDLWAGKSRKDARSMKNNAVRRTLLMTWARRKGFSEFDPDEAKRNKRYYRQRFDRDNRNRWHASSVYKEYLEDKLKTISDEQLVEIKNISTLADYCRLSFMNDDLKLPKPKIKIDNFSRYAIVNMYLKKYAELRRMALTKWIEYESNLPTVKEKKDQISYEVLYEAEQNILNNLYPLYVGKGFIQSYSFKDILDKYRNGEILQDRTISAHEGKIEFKNGKNPVEYGEHILLKAVEKTQHDFNEVDRILNIMFEKYIDAVRDDIINDYGRDDKITLTYDRLIVENWNILRNIFRERFGQERTLSMVRDDYLQYGKLPEAYDTYLIELLRFKLDCEYDKIKKTIPNFEKMEKENYDVFEKNFGLNGIKELLTYENMKKAIQITSEKMEREQYLLKDNIKKLFDETVKLLSRSTSDYYLLISEIKPNENVTIIESENKNTLTNPNNASD